MLRKLKNLHLDFDKNMILFNKYFNIFIENPLKTWWKAKEYFKFPKIEIHKVGKLIHKKVHTEFGDYVDDGLYWCPYVYTDKLKSILNIFSSDVLWKDKYDSPRHERNPIIWILFFKRIGFCITFNVTYLDELGKVRDGNMYYWEFLLNYVYYEHDLKLALNASGPWTVSSKLWKQLITPGAKEDGSNDEYKPYNIVIQHQLFSLNKKGLKKLESLI